MAPPQIENDQLAIQRFDMNDERRSYVQFDGRTFSTLSVESALFPVKPGNTVVGPAIAEAIYRDPSAPSRPQFGLFTRNPRKTLSSNRLELKVMPLPEKEKPENFRGAVGQFEMSAIASPTSLKLGDPISVDIEITGAGNFESLEFPDFEDADGWRFYPSREVSKVLSDGVTGGRIVFSRVIVPLQEHSEIPPFKLSFFDPEEEKYVTLNTQAIPIEVTPDDGLQKKADIYSVRDGIDAPLDSTSPSSQPAPRPQPTFKDILYIIDEPAAFTSKPTSVTHSVLFWLAQLPPALLAGSMLWILAVRQYRVRSALAKTKPQRPSSLEIRSEIESKTLSRYDFYRSVLDFLDRWQSEQSDASKRSTTEAQELRERAHQNLYSPNSTRDQDTSSLPSKERNGALEVLKRLTS
ncbi:MAG: BatD family protein [Verrucomicrobiota bacterium]